MRVVFMGTPDFAAGILEALCRGGHEVVSAVSQPDRPRGRKQSLTSPTPVHLLADRLGIRVLQPEDPGDPDFIEVLGAIGPEAIVVAAYGNLLGRDILSLAPCINVHASLLPRWRGASPIQQAIMAGDSVTGVTTMLMDEGLDTGDILLCESLAIASDETAQSLTVRLMELGEELILRTLSMYSAGMLSPTPQSDEGAVFAPRITKDMGLIDWQASAIEIERKVRGLYPAPGAYSFGLGRLIKILSARATDEERTDAAPGTLTPAGGRLLVATGSGLLEILTLRPEGKGEMSGEEYLRGHSITCFTHERSG